MRHLSKLVFENISQKVYGIKARGECIKSNWRCVFIYCTHYFAVGDLNINILNIICFKL